MKFRFVITVVCCFFTLVVRAGEGMWILGNLGKQIRRTMRGLDLQMPADKLYSSRCLSLKDAIVSFGGFCSRVAVSEDGLVFTNHHCDFSCVQQHSFMEHDYLKDGFMAYNRNEELPNPELYVRFLLWMEDVTKRVLDTVKPGMAEAKRSAATGSAVLATSEEVAHKDSTLVGAVDACYGGNEFWLSVYRDYSGVRLVLASSSSVGRFGWDTGNWTWPRHTGDFCVFCIYADRNNCPVDYSPESAPYHPEYVAPVSLDGYKEGSLCITLGYPGRTERYLFSFGIEEMMNNDNQAQIDVRGIEQTIWKREMDRQDSIRIKYVSKHDESSNYWKNSIGVDKATRRSHILEKKHAIEQELCRWVQQALGERETLLQLSPDLKLDYRNVHEANYVLVHFAEAFLSGPELVQLALSISNFDFEGEQKAVMANPKVIVEKYASLDLETDKGIFATMLKEYRSKVDSTYPPEFYGTIATRYGGSDKAYMDSLYASSESTIPRGLRRFLEQDTTYHIHNDPAINLRIDLIGKIFGINM